MITKADLLECPVNINDMEDFIKAEFPTIISEYQYILNSDQPAYGGYNRKEALAELAEDWMQKPEKISDVEQWLLNDKK